MLIWLVRHGETELNNDADVSQDRIRAWRDVPLNQAGRDTAKDTAEHLQDKRIEVIVSSDLSRARETADIIGKALGIHPIYTNKLRPWDLGMLTGQSTKDAIPKIKEYVDHPDRPVPKGESFNSFMNRAFAGVADAIDRAQGETLCLVTHHRVERLLKAWIAAGQPVDHNEIDLRVFTSKGEPPGKAETISVDAQKVRAIRNEPLRGTVERSIKELQSVRGDGGGP